MAVILSAVAIHLASEFLIPVALALVLTGLLWPAVQQLARWRIPSAAGATICVVGAVGIFVVIGSTLGPTVSKFVDEIPKSIDAARPKIAAMSASLNRITGGRRASVAAPAKTQSKTTAKPAVTKPDSAANDSVVQRNDSANVARVASSATDSARTAADSSSRATDSSARKPTPAPAARAPSTQSPAAQPLTIPSANSSSITYALGVAGSLISEFIEVILLALFVLAAGSAWREKLSRSVSEPEKQSTVAETVGEMRSVVSRYLLVTALINVAQGVVVALALNWLGYSSPMLWGVLTFALEFVPYMGGLIVVALLIVVGLAGGRGFPLVFAGPAAYLAVTTLQNNVLSPIVYGKHMKLNPVAILLSLMLWYMLWGVAGAFLAVPILAAFNVMAARVPELKPVSVFLSE